MARRIRDTSLETRTARLRLKRRGKPYWRMLDKGLQVGYRRSSDGGSWVARRYVGARQYEETRIAIADDTSDADGGSILDFSQAQEKARTWRTTSERRDSGLDPLTGLAPEQSIEAYLVSDAVRDYMTWFTRHRKSARATQRVAEFHILPALGKLPVARLTTPRIRDWFTNIAESKPRLRSSKVDAPKYRDTTRDPEDAKRRRRATANRVLTVLKAALNHAFRDGNVRSDDAWRRVRPFRGVEEPVVRYLQGDEMQRLVNACDPDFAQLVRAALLTGCRYGELIALHTSDFNADVGTLAIRTSKSGKPRHVVLTDEGQQFLAMTTLGKSRGDRLFTHANGQPWGYNWQIRPFAEACKRARIATPITFHGLRHTYASQLAMKGVPLTVIAAQLGHADTRITERHYAHLAPSYVAETVRAAFPTLGIVGPSNVVGISKKRS